MGGAIRGNQRLGSDQGLLVHNWKVDQGENRQEDNHVYV
jgi:hypothetical protein